ncbi:hypothetical protein Tco_1103133 [Tanacetum coccineum]
MVALRSSSPFRVVLRSGDPQTPFLFTLDDVIIIDWNAKDMVIKAYHGQEGGFDTNGCSFKGIWANIVGTSNFLLIERYNSAPIILIKTKIVLSMDRIKLWAQWSWNWSPDQSGC